MNTNIKNVHVLIVKFAGWTEKLPSRIVISSTDERFKQPVTIPFETDRGNDTCEIAEYWLKEKGFNILFHSIAKDCYYIITDTFLPFDHYKKIITKPAK